MYDLNYEIYTIENVMGEIRRHTVAQFATNTDMHIALPAFVSAYGDRLYARATTPVGERIFGKLAKCAKFLITPTRVA